MKPIVLFAGTMLTFVFLGFAADEKAPNEHRAFSLAEIKWVDGPPSLPPGAKMAILEGDPKHEGLFTMRLKVPAGYKIPPHTHPAVEHVTVISGTAYFGMGEKFDQSAAQEMPAGGFIFMPAQMKHFAWMKGETVVQVHGVGPWQINYVNPADDPRNAKK
jgi:quercetin dioxygenase-like cupin family protein